MCTRPITHEGKTFACRSCNECIAVRRHNWVARAMAEKSLWPHTLVVALTYGSDTQQAQDGAQMFAYSDVMAFLHRLRKACLRRQKGARLSFLCAGEQGDRNGRCHWHMIIYSDLDLTKVGQFSMRGRKVTERDKMISVGKRKIRLHWSTWGHGFVTLQEPDEGGMHYVLSYCLKDQFTMEKSKDTLRFAKAERFATGLFKMSKKPPIGARWLGRKLAGLVSANSVLPNLKIKIPEMSGYWYPGGAMRERLLWQMVAANQSARFRTGQDAPQWSTLLANSAENEKDMGILQYDKAQQEKRQAEEEEFARSVAAKRDEFGQSALGEFRRKCGRAIPCDECLHGWTEKALASRGVQRYEDAAGVWRYKAAAGWPGLGYSERPGNGINPDCQKRGTPEAARAFPATGRKAG
jgi:hypothetical protein